MSFGHHVLISTLVIVLASLLVFITSAIFDLSGQGGYYEAEQAATLSTHREKRESTILFVGDIMLSRGIGKIIEREGIRHPFFYTEHFLKDADITFGNLEGPISDIGKNQGSIYSFRASPKALSGLLYSGFDVLSLANNHIVDYGGEALSDTITLLEQAGISSVGAGANYEAAHASVIREVRGTRIAFLAYTNLLPPSYFSKSGEPAISGIDERELSDDIARARKMAHLVIVSFHWGEEYETKHNAFQERIGHLAIDSGADLIVGHHPHVVQDIEEYNGKYIAYSLGNFIFDQNFPGTEEGLMLRAFVWDGGIRNVEPILVKFTDTYQPYLAQSPDGVDF